MPRDSDVIERPWLKATIIVAINHTPETSIQGPQTKEPGRAVGA